MIRRHLYQDNKVMEVQKPIKSRESEKITACQKYDLPKAGHLLNTCQKCHWHAKKLSSDFPPGTLMAAQIPGLCLFKKVSYRKTGYFHQKKKKVWTEQMLLPISASLFGVLGRCVECEYGLPHLGTWVCRWTHQWGTSRTRRNGIPRVSLPWADNEPPEDCRLAEREARGVGADTNSLTPKPWPQDPMSPSQSPWGPQGPLSKRVRVFCERWWESWIGEGGGYKRTGLRESS